MGLSRKDGYPKSNVRDGGGRDKGKMPGDQSEGVPKASTE